MSACTPLHVFALLACFIALSLSCSFQSAKGGQWRSASTWTWSGSGARPKDYPEGPECTAVILSGHQVTLTNTRLLQVTVGNVVVEGVLTVGRTSGSPVFQVNADSITVNGRVNHRKSSIVVVGDLVVTGRYNAWDATTGYLEVTSRLDIQGSATWDVCALKLTGSSVDVVGSIPCCTRCATKNVLSNLVISADSITANAATICTDELILPDASVAINMPKDDTLKMQVRKVTSLTAGQSEVDATCGHLEFIDKDNQQLEYETLGGRANALVWRAKTVTYSRLFYPKNNSWWLNWGHIQIGAVGASHLFYNFADGAICVDELVLYGLSAGEC